MSNRVGPGREAAVAPNARASSRIALAMSGGASLTHAQLEEAACRAANMLRGFDLAPGAHVAYMLDNSVEAVVFAMAAQRAGLYFTPIATHLKIEEVAYIVTDCRARIVLTSPRYMPLLEEVSRRSPDILVLNTDRHASADVSFWANVEACQVEPTAPETEGFAMLYSSGTTGRPKGVIRPLTGARFGSEKLSVLYVHHGLGADTVYLSPAPLYHAAPIRCVMAVQRLGGASIVMEKFDAEGLLKEVERWRATHIQLVPTMMRRLIDLPPAVRSQYDLSSVRTIIHAAAPCPHDVKRAMIDWFGPIVNEYYGGTEGVGITYITSPEWLSHPGSVGRPIIGRVRIVDDHGNEAPPHEPGLVYFEGGPRFSYHNAPEKTAASYNAAGWATLGDIGFVNDDGYLFLVDRASFTINSGGVNIYPREIEDVLLEHPGVRDVAVFGVPNEEFGEEVKAVVECEPGAEVVTARELIEFCRMRLSNIKAPRSVEFVDALPRSDAGKVLKADLKRRYWMRG